MPTKQWKAIKIYQSASSLQFEVSEISLGTGSYRELCKSRQHLEDRDNFQIKLLGGEAKQNASRVTTKDPQESLADTGVVVHSSTV